MIKISIFEDENGIYNGFRLEGHAEYADPGEDIICSAISILVINTINSIEAFTEDAFLVDSNDAAGLIEFHMTSEISSESNLLLSSLSLGLHAMEKEYGNEYIEIIE